MLVAVALVHGAVWLRSVNRLSGALNEQAGVLRSYGSRVTAGPIRWRGWPGRAAVETGPASIDASLISWTAERVVAEAPLLRPGPVDVYVVDQRVRFGQGRAIAITSRTVTNEAVVDGFIVAGTEIGIGGAFYAEALRAHLDAAGLAVTARHIRLPGMRNAPGPSIDGLTLRAVPTSPVPPAESPRAALAAWRDGGGVLTLPELVLTVGQLQLSGQARIWFDDALQPRLDGFMHVTGFAAGLDSLAAEGLMESGNATAIKAVLSLLAGSSPDRSADLPVQVVNGVFSIARFPLLRLPTIDWSALAPER